MNKDIQKAIDILEYNKKKGEYSVSGKELKSLLEQVAEEQRESDDEFCDNHWIWIDKGRETILDNEIVTDNLTFNEE